MLQCVCCVSIRFSPNIFQNQFRTGLILPDILQEQIRLDRLQTVERLDHGRSSHFAFGYTPCNYESENKGNFVSKCPDYTTVAAGMTEGRVPFNFTHLNHRFKCRLL